MTKLNQSFMLILVNVHDSLLPCACMRLVTSVCVCTYVYMSGKKNNLFIMFATRKSPAKCLIFSLRLIPCMCVCVCVCACVYLQCHTHAHIHNTIILFSSYSSSSSSLCFCCSHWHGIDRKMFYSSLTGWCCSGSVVGCELIAVHSSGDGIDTHKLWDMETGKVLWQHYLW